MINPIQPIKDNITFGIYKGTRPTHYGECDYGIFKNNRIEVYKNTYNKKISKLLVIDEFI